MKNIVKETGMKRQSNVKSWTRRVGVLLCLLIGNIFYVGSVTASPIKILAFGDSLTAGYGVQENEAFPARLQAAMTAAGRTVSIENAGVSGDTSAGGLARLDWALGNGKPDLIIVELGANDGLRGLPPTQTESNLDAILTRLKQENIPILLAGMLAPPNMGKEYGQEFNAIYPRLAQKHGVTLYPFFLDGVIGHPDLLQRDGLHPTPAGVDVVVSKIMPVLDRMLGETP